MNIPHDALQAAHISIGVLTGAATSLLALMFWNASLTNRDRFTTLFLKLLAMCAAAKAVEIGSAMYRASRIAAEAIPNDAALVGLSGRSIELAAYVIIIWFMLRPETKKALNGGQHIQSGNANQ